MRSFRRLRRAFEATTVRFAGSHVTNDSMETRRRQRTGLFISRQLNWPCRGCASREMIMREKNSRSLRRAP